MPATRTLGGIVYRETLAVGEGGPVYEPVASAEALDEALGAGDAADALIVGASGSRRAERLRERETPAPMYVRPPEGARPADFAVRTWLADRAGRELTEPRAVEDVETLAGVELVAARLTLAEADALVCPPASARIAIDWIVELERPGERRQAVSVLEIDRQRH